MGKFGNVLFWCIVGLIISITIEVITESVIALAIAIIFGGIAAAIIYFIPAIVAENRRHRNAGAIGILNFFLGWTFLGWVICLVWASTNDLEDEEVIENRSTNKYDDLKKLQELKESGTLTDEEFEKEKAKILN